MMAGFHSIAAFRGAVFVACLQLAVACAEQPGSGAATAADAADATAGAEMAAAELAGTSVDAAATDATAVPEAGPDAAAPDDAGLSDAFLAETGLADALEPDLDVADGAAADAAGTDIASGALDVPEADTAAPASDVAGTDATPDTPPEVAIDVDAPDTVVPVDAKGPKPGSVSYSGPIACKPGATKPGVFTNIAKSLGIDLVRPAKWPEGMELAGKTIHEGGGSAAADFDGDGVVDLYFATMVGPDRLYLSAGKGPLAYTAFDVPQSGTGTAGVIAVDLDNDDDPDVVLPGLPPRVLRNDGPAKFTDVTKALLPTSTDLPLLVASVADMDADGLLDVLFISNKDEGNGFPPPAMPNVLMRATGPWQFVDVTSWLPAGPDAIGYAGTWADLDDDGDLDLYMVNDLGQMVQPNRMFRNDGKKAGKVSFSDVSFASGLDVASSGMGCAVGDYDRDGDLDVLITGVDTQNYLFSGQAGAIVFTDVTKKTGVVKSGKGRVSWAPVLFDADNDGWLDLFVANSWKQGLSGSGWNQPFEQADSLLRNDTKGAFDDVTAAAGVGDTGSSRSAVMTDLDSDGFLDLVVGGVWGTPLVYRNGCDDSGWLEVRLTGTTSNRDGIGARVTVKVGGVTLVREIDAGSTGLQGSHEPMAHFGLGKTAQVVDVQVRWPSGKVQGFKDVAVRQIVHVVEP